MLDQTLGISLAITLFEVVLLLIMVGLCIAIVTGVIKKVKGQEDIEKESKRMSMEQILYEARWKGGAVIILGLCLGFFMSIETAYRPKHDVAPVNSALMQKLREADAFVPPAITVEKEQPEDWEAVRDKNRA